MKKALAIAGILALSIIPTPSFSEELEEEVLEIIFYKTKEGRKYRCKIFADSKIEALQIVHDLTRANEITDYDECRFIRFIRDE